MTVAELFAELNKHNDPDVEVIIDVPGLGHCAISELIKFNWPIQEGAILIKVD